VAGTRTLEENLDHALDQIVSDKRFAKTLCGKDDTYETPPRNRRDDLNKGERPTCVRVDQFVWVAERQRVVGVGLLRVGEGTHFVHPQVDLLTIIVLHTNKRA
jgi:hypothetical protein